MSARRLARACLLALLPVLGVGPVPPLLPVTGSFAQEAGPGMMPADPPRPVVSEIVSDDPAGQRAFPGVVRGENVLMLAFRTSGRMVTLNVEAGDLVAEGEVLATLDGITLQEDLDAARAALDAAEAEARLALQQFERTKSLVARGVATEEAQEQTEAARDSAKARAQSARARLTQAQDAAEYGTLTAPRGGIVLSTEVEPGTLVSPGTGILQMVDERGREAVVDVPAAFARILPENAMFTVRHHSEDVAPVTARLRLVEPVTETSLDTRRLRLALQDPPADFRIGSLVSASYRAEGAPVMTLPALAVTKGPDGPGVWRVTAARQVEFVPVTLGPDVGARVVILSGVAPGDEIVTRGAGSLQNGQSVGRRIGERLE